MGHEGCIFCNPCSYSPSRRAGNAGAIARQIKDATERLRHRYGTERFLAYFQPGSNTYAPPSRLHQAYREALVQPGIVGIVVGTRPDCLSTEVLDVLAEFASQTWLTVELGLQSIHAASLEWLGRKHSYAQFLQAVHDCRNVPVRVGVHVILGIPGEPAESMHATARELARLKVDAVKLHNLHAVQGTELANMVLAGQVKVPEQEEYVSWVVDFLERLPVECVVERLVGDAPGDFLVAPAWCAKKTSVLAAIEAEFERRGTRQGALAIP